MLNYFFKIPVREGLDLATIVIIIMTQLQEGHCLSHYSL